MKFKIFIILSIIFCYFFGLSRVLALPLEECTNNSYYVDYSDVYLELSQDSSLKTFYSDFKDWFDNQNDFNYYIFYKQGSGTTDVFNYRIVLFTNPIVINFKHNSTSSFNYFAFVLSYTGGDIPISYYNSNDLVFDSSKFSNGNLNIRNYDFMYQLGEFANFNENFSFFDTIDNDSKHKKFKWVFSNYGSNTSRITGSFILIDSNIDIPLTNTTGFLPFKVNDNYYCIGDNLPSVNSIYPFSDSGGDSDEPVNPPYVFGFYNKVQELLGQLPEQYNIIYLISSLLLFLGLFLILFIPIILIYKKFKQ